MSVPSAGSGGVLPSSSHEYDLKSGDLSGRKCVPTSCLSKMLRNMSTILANIYHRVCAFFKKLFNRKTTLNPDIKTTIEGFPITPPEIVGAVYQEMKLLHGILEEYGIRYWIDGGSLLGLERHGGVFPWDDDADIEIHPDDCDKLAELAKNPAFQGRLQELRFKLIDHWQGWKFVPLDMPEGGAECYSTSTNGGQGGHFFTPCIDLFKTQRVFDKKSGRQQFVLNEQSQGAFKNNFFYEDEICDESGQIPLADFGPIKVHAPRDGRPYLYRYYGDNVMTHAYKTFSHLTAGLLSSSEGRRTLTVIQDFSPAQWVENSVIYISL